MPSLIVRVFGRRSSLQRQYALATVVFLVLVTGIILTFGHLISRSLSRRYLEDVLISGRQEAQRLADELGGGEVEDLNVLSTRREQLIRTLERYDKRQVIESFKVMNSQGDVVFESYFHSEEKVPKQVVEDLDIGSVSDQNVVQTQDTFKIAVPLGEVGEVVVNLSKARVAERLARLRRELLVQTVAAAIFTLATLVVAFVLVWLMIQRTRRLEAATRESEEFAALGTLAANLAHEIRNPLNSINLNLELLEEDLTGEETDVKGSLASTRREVGRLARLVSDFLAYARPAAPVLEEVRVADILGDVREFLRAEARAAGVHLRLDPELPEAGVTCDEAQLRQVLLNLVLNAVQAVAGLEAERRVVDLAAACDEDEVTMVVRDRGDGIPPEELEQVRRAFYTRRRGGTGLGLAIAERFARAHGGHIELVNLEPFGFEARVVLPRAAGGGKMSPRRPAKAGPSGRTG